MLEYLIKGKFMMVPLMVCSVLALAVLMDRFSAFTVNGRVDTRSLRAKILELLGLGKLKEAALLCMSTPGPVSAVILAGLQAYSRLKAVGVSHDTVRTVVEKAMDDCSVRAMSAVEKRLTVLSTVGNAAPLFGMAGTVLGMINAFGNIERLKTMEASVVAGGISEALITTAAGLLIALMAVIPFHIFTAMANGVDLEIAESAAELLDFVTTEEGRGSESHGS